MFHFTSTAPERYARAKYRLRTQKPNTRPNTLHTSPYMYHNVMHVVPSHSVMIRHTVFKRVGGPNQIVCAIAYLLKHETWPESGHAFQWGPQRNDVDTGPS